jgi:hypothetical protein
VKHVIISGMVYQDEISEMPYKCQPVRTLFLRHIVTLPFRLARQLRFNLDNILALDHHQPHLPSSPCPDGNRAFLGIIKQMFREKFFGLSEDDVLVVVGAHKMTDKGAAVFDGDLESRVEERVEVHDVAEECNLESGRMTTIK